MRINNNNGIYLLSCIFFPLLLLNQFATAQNKAPCEAVQRFLNLKEVGSGFNKQKPKDSALVLIDAFNKLDPCSSIQWAGTTLSIRQDSLVTAELQAKTPYAIFKNRCSYYLLMDIKKDKKKYYVYILQPCSGLVSKGEIKIKKSKTIIKFLENSIVH